MSVSLASQSPRIWPEPRALLTLIKPITWFPPMWAYLCGVVSSGGSIMATWPMVVLGILLAGPIVCGMSQAANDWCDRHVDAVNEPHRPIPSGRIPGRWGLYVALAMTALSLVVGWQLGPWGFYATGPGLVGLCYEGLPWFTGAAVMVAGAPRFEVVTMAILYAFGAHGIMTLNDFKALEGDRQHGVRSLPVTLGPEVAAKVACTVMGLALALVIAMLFVWDKPWHALAVTAVLLAQFAAMRVLLRDPRAKAPWYNGTGVVLYVSGMMVTAFALRRLGAM